VLAGAGVTAGAADDLLGFAKSDGLAKSPLKTKERTTIKNDRMCFGIHASLTYFDFLWEGAHNII
jgi:hypothetical protein